MSDWQASAAFPKALECDEAASAWLIRQEYETWGERDQREFETWLAESLAHRIAFVRLEAGWKRTERLTVLQSPMRSTDLPVSGRVSRPKSLKLAAVLLMIASIGAGGVFYTTRPTQAVYATGLGEREVLSLADGSQIELNTETSLRTAVTAGRRTVWLEKGEAYFRVKHDAAHPFLVIVGNRRLTDIGTAFTVRRDTARLRVAVLEGSVRLDTDRPLQAGAKTAILKSGDTAVASATALSISREEPKALSDELGWRRGVLIFNQTSLSDAAIEINRYNRKKIIISDDAARHIKIGGTFPKNNVDAITAAVRELFGLHVEDRGNEIIVSLRQGSVTRTER